MSARWIPAAAAALLCASLARAEQPLPVYPGTVHTRIGKDLLVAGEYYRIAYFVTDDPPAKVGKYFQDAWKKDGYPVTVDGDFQPEGVVSAFYTREGLMRSVVLRAHQGRTVGFSVLKDLWLQEPLARATKVPALEGTLFSQDVVARDDDGRAQHRAQLVEGTSDQVRQAAVQAWAAQGYSLVRETAVAEQGGRRRVLELARPGEQVVLTLVDAGKRLVAVQQSWVGTDRPDAVPNDLALEKRKAAQGARR